MSSPFKGEVRRGMGRFGGVKPIPTPTLPLKYPQGIKGGSFMVVAEV